MDTFLLKVSESSGRTYQVAVDHFPFTIGRGTENDLSLQCSSVSRRHASIETVGDDLVIVDNNSRNRVFVNGQQLPKSKLRRGDRLRIGSVEMKLIGPPPVKIPSASKQAEALYFPHQESWDPIQTLSSAIPRGDLPVSERKQPDWQSLLRITLSSDTRDVYDTFLDTIEETTPFHRCFLMLFEGGSLDRTKVLARRISSRQALPSSTKTSEIFVSREILRRVARSREAVLVTRDDVSFGLRDSFIRTGARTALCLPLVVRESVLGVLYMDRMPHVDGFTQQDIEVLGPIAGIIALKVDNVQLFEAHVAAEVNRKELEIAESVQQSLYPRERVRLPGYSVEGFTRPCFQVGGDYFDFFTEDESRLTWVLGDVSGKGLSSALYMVSVLSALRAHVADGLPLEVLMSRLEGHVRQNFRPDHFLTLFLARLERDSGLLTYCNAGHLAPVVCRESGEVVELECSDPALNILPWSNFTRYEYRMAPGDLLLAYTDGLVEGEGEHGDQFGDQRAVECVRNHRGKELASIRKRVLSELEEFTVDDDLHDDVTLVMIRRDPLPD